MDYPLWTVSLKAFLFVSITQENSHRWLSEAEKENELIGFRFTYIFTTQKTQLVSSFQERSLMLSSDINSPVRGLRSLSLLCSKYLPLPVVGNEHSYHNKSWHIPSLCYKAQTVVHTLFSGIWDFPYPFQCQIQVTNCTIMSLTTCSNLHYLLAFVDTRNKIMKNNLLEQIWSNQIESSL